MVAINRNIAVASNVGLFGELSTTPTISPSSSPVMFGWQGLSLDTVSGNWDNEARQYAENTGTFTSQDPKGLEGAEVNLYESRRDNPLIYSDPDGQDPLVVAGTLIGAGLNAYNAYKAGGSTKQILLSAGTGAISGGIAGLTGGIGFFTGVAGASAAGYFNNSTNQLIFTGKIDLNKAVKTGAVSGIIGAFGASATALSNRYIYDVFSKGLGFTAGTVLEMNNSSGIPTNPSGNTIVQPPCP